MPRIFSPRASFGLLSAILLAACSTPVSRAPNATLPDDLDASLPPDGGDEADAGEITTPGPIGDGCRTDADCESGLCRTDLPGGYCTEGCRRSSDCPDGARCVQTQSNGTQCIATCGSSADCRDGYSCRQGFCVPGCSSNADCAAGQRCDLRSGQCVTPMQGSAIGGACAANTDCTEGGAQARCFPEQYGFPGGYCTAICSARSPCPNGNACVEFSSPQGSTSYCLDSCGSDRDCRSGYYCSPLQGGGSACLPPCSSDNDCDTGFVCNTSNGRCVPPLGGTDGGTPTPDAGSPDAGPIVTDGGYAGTTTRTSLGTINGGRPAPVTVDLPADAVSSFFIATPSAGQPTSGYYIGLGWLNDPNQTTLYSSYSGSNWPFRAYPNENGAAGILFPNAPPPGLNYLQGQYTAQFFSAQTSVNLDLTHVLKRASGPLTGGTLDLNLWFDTSLGNAAQFKAGTNFTAMLSTIRTIWASVGITVGNVNFYDLADPQRAYRNIQDGEIGDVCRLTGSAPNDSVNLVFVDSISGSGGGGTILGMAAGIPGTPLRGSGASCVVVGMSSWQGSSTVPMFATTIVHETGHWMGLFHTTEATGTEFDPLPDTLTCPAGSYDRNGDGRVSDTECSARDGLNVMFWLSDSTGRNPHTTFTANQQFVLLRHPSVY
jgi:hypothetical protein